MEKFGITNDDIQEIFNEGFSEDQSHKTLTKNGFIIGIHYNYDGYNLRYVIISVFKRPLQK